MNQLDRIYGMLMESPRPLPMQQSYLRGFSSEAPIAPIQRSEWTVEQQPERLVRTFEFDSFDDMTEFVYELFAYERMTQHNAKHTIEENTVTVEVYTHGVNRVTELDQEYKQSIDQIYELMFIDQYE